MTTLLDVLVKEMKVWPEGAVYVGQSCDGTLHLNGFGGFMPLHNLPLLSHTKETYSLPAQGNYYPGIVHEQEWRDAKNKAINDNPWKRNRRGKMPIGCAESALVDVKLRNGNLSKLTASEMSEMDWSINGSADDIMQWRLSIPTVENVILTETADVGKESPEASLFAQRERYFAINDEISAKETEIANLRKEQAEIVKSVESQGFKIVEVIAETSQSLNKIPAIEWKAGDVVESVIDVTAGITRGAQYTLTKDAKRENHIGVISFKDADGDPRERLAEEYKLVSRAN